MASRNGRARVVVEDVSPSVDGGRFPAARVASEPVVVEADAFVDGHDRVRVRLLHRRRGRRKWLETEMDELPNDRWRGSFSIEEIGRYEFAVEAWVDHFRTWQRDMFKRVGAGQEVGVDLRIGAELVEGAAERAEGAGGGETETARMLRAAARVLAGEAEGALGWEEEIDADASLPSGLAAVDPGPPTSHAAHHAGPTVDPAETVRERTAANARLRVALSDALKTLVDRHPDRSHVTRSDPVLRVRADRERARFSTWYEFFPRSCGEAGRHGTFEDCLDRLDYVAGMGFDVVYLPPIHPIGETNRKGRNNAVVAEPGDVGSPWAIGSEAGGHKAVHPELGDFEDFRRFVKEAEDRGLEVALDVAFQVAPDHPYVERHPEWFRSRPDGTIQYAENPPKKYEDIYPFDFETEDWETLWRELKSVFAFWIDQGVRIFRVDNPHTKAFPFWEWCVAELEREHPDVILLAEAFTRPKIMYRLAKLGFHQSYTYFAWRYSKDDFQAYLRELTAPPVSDFFRPSFWPNTPDILTEQLQVGGRPVFMQRLVLAATLSASYGIYGPAFELVERAPREPGSEEYLDSEKYEVRDWDLDREWSLAPFITRVNEIRRRFPALQRNDTLRFVEVDNEMLLAYVKTPPEDGAARGRSNPATGTILTVVNLDSHHRQSGWLDLPLAALGLEPDETFRVSDLLSGDRYQWQGARNYVELDPGVVPAHVFHVERRARSEEDFDSYV